jgi:hypothetical protein
MDWALRDAFDAADAEPVGLPALAAIVPGQWAALRFEPHPSLRLLTLDWAIEAAWRALREHDPASGDDEPTLPEPEAHEHLLLVWRHGLETQWRSLPALEGALLQAALQRETFGQLCERAAQSVEGGEAEAATAAAMALQQWLNDGLFSALSLAG